MRVLAVEVLLAVRGELRVPSEVVGPGVEEQSVVQLIPSLGIRACASALPDDFVAKVAVAKNLVEHHLDVVARVIVAVVVETPCGLEDAGEFHAARPHVVDVRLCALVPVVEGPLLLALPPEDLVVAITVEGRVDIDQIDALLGELRQLLQVVPTIDDPRI